MQLAVTTPFSAPPRADRRQVMSYGMHTEQRGAPRFLVPTSAEIRDASGTHVAFLRDLSANGVFVYSKFTPSCGDQLEIEIGMRNHSATNVAIRCRGKVVRVEQPANGAATGIAVRITGYSLRVANAKQ